jgi:inosine-uridine nucleoside N-ribohydrolase
MSDKIPLIIDCDPGIDDAFAIYYAFAQKRFDVKAIIPVAGNVPLEMTLANACNLVHHAGVDVPVYMGADGPLMGEKIEAKYAHGVNGLGGFVFPSESRAALKDGNVVDVYARLLNEAPEPIVIAAVGPLTNLAKLLMAYPGIESKIKALYVMGGGVSRGNITTMAEFNIAADPLSAKIVFRANIDTYIVPLEATETAYFDKPFMAALRDSNAKLATTLFEIVDAKAKYNALPEADRARFGELQAFLKTAFDDLPENHRFYLHDMVTLAALIIPEAFAISEHHVDVELYGDLTKGMTVFDTRTFRQQTPNAKLVLIKDRDAIVAHCQEVLTHV